MSSGGGGTVRFVLTADAERARAELARARQEIQKLQGQMKSLREEVRHQTDVSKGMWKTMTDGAMSFVKAYAGTQGVLFVINEVTKALREQQRVSQQALGGVTSIGQAQMGVQEMIADWSDKQVKGVFQGIDKLVKDRQVQLFTRAELTEQAKTIITGTSGSPEARNEILTTALKMADAFAGSRQEFGRIGVAGAVLARRLGYDPKVGGAEQEKLLRMGFTAAPLAVSQTRLESMEGMAAFARSVAASEVMDTADKQQGIGHLESLKRAYDSFRSTTALFTAIGQAIDDKSGRKTATGLNALANGLRNMLPAAEQIDKHGKTIAPLVDEFGNRFLTTAQRLEAVQTKGAYTLKGEFIKPGTLQQQLLVGEEGMSKYLVGPEIGVLPALEQLVKGGKAAEIAKETYGGLMPFEKAYKSDLIEMMIRRNRQGLHEATRVEASIRERESQAETEMMDLNLARRAEIEARIFGEKGIYAMYAPSLRPRGQQLYGAMSALQGPDQAAESALMFHWDLRHRDPNYQGSWGYFPRDRHNLTERELTIKDGFDRAMIHELKRLNVTQDRTKRLLQGVGSRAAAAGQQEGR